MTEADVLRDTARRLDELGVEYMLTGSFALGFYTEPRFTRDIDVVIALASDKIWALVKAFQEDYYISADAVEGAVRSRGMFNAISNKGITKVDFIIHQQSAFQTEAFNRRIRRDVEGQPVWVISREDLILSKLSWARDSESDFQLRDIGNLLAPSLDREYLERWMDDLGVRALWGKLKHE